MLVQWSLPRGSSVGAMYSSLLCHDLSAICAIATVTVCSAWSGTRRVSRTVPRAGPVHLCLLPWPGHGLDLSVYYCLYH